MLIHLQYTHCFTHAFFYTGIPLHARIFHRDTLTHSSRHVCMFWWWWIWWWWWWEMILANFAGSNFLGKTLCRPFRELVVSVLTVDGVCPLAAVSVVSQLCFASWWRFGGVSVSLEGVRWCFGSRSCFHGVSVVSWQWSGGVVVVSKKLYFFWPILHTGAFTYRCTQKKYTYIHAFTRRNSQHKLATKHRILTSVLDDGHAFHPGTVLSAQVQQKQIAISLQSFVINKRFVRGPFTAHRPNCNFTPVFFAINTCFLREKFIAHRPHRILTSVFADRRVFRTGRARLLNCNLILQCLTIDRRFAREGCVSPGSTRIAVPPRNGTL